MRQEAGGLCLYQLNERFNKHQLHMQMISFAVIIKRTNHLWQPSVQNTVPPMAELPASSLSARDVVPLSLAFPFRLCTLMLLFACHY